MRDGLPRITLSIISSPTCCANAYQPGSKYDVAGRRASTVFPWAWLVLVLLFAVKRAHYASTGRTGRRFHCSNDGAAGGARPIWIASPLRSKSYKTLQTEHHDVSKKKLFNRSIASRSPTESPCQESVFKRGLNAWHANAHPLMRRRIQLLNNKWPSMCLSECLYVHTHTHTHKHTPNSHTHQVFCR